MEGSATDLSERNGQPGHSVAALNGTAQAQHAHSPSVSLSSPEQSEPDSDFALDGAATEAGHSRPGSSEDDLSDDSLYGGQGRKRRKVQKAKAAKRVRPHVDNDQTRKLRSALTEDEPSTASGVSAQVANGFAHNSMQGSESAAAVPGSEELTDEDDDEMDSQSRPIERHLTAEEHAQQLQQVQSMWQMASILEFLHTFSAYLNIRDNFTPEELEVAIVSDIAQTGLLANLHQDLLRGITSRTDLNSNNWAAYFANRLKYQWTSTHIRGSPPFAPAKRQEAHDYAALHAADRVLALKLLCEVRLDKDDLRSALELAMKPAKAPPRPPSGKTRAAGASSRGRSEPAPDVVMDVRHEPFGEGKDGVLYWYLDLGPSNHASLTGTRLYKEVPAEQPPSPTPQKSTRGKDAAPAKGKGTKGRGKKAKMTHGGSLVSPPAAPSWELLGSSTDEFQAVGEDLTGSASNAEADIGYQLLDDVVPTLVARAEALEKRAKAAAKVAAQLSNIVPDDNGHYGRSRRQRTQVNYNYDEYDKTIKDAIRGGRHEVWEQPSARMQRDWSRPAPVESRRAGLRGGKPDEAAHYSPDENRPSNEQSGAPEQGSDRLEPDSNAESEFQAANGWAADAHANSHAAYAQHDGAGHSNDQYANGWGQNGAAGPVYQHSFAVVNECVNHGQQPNSHVTTSAFFT